MDGINLIFLQDIFRIISSDSSKLFQLEILTRAIFSFMFFMYYFLFLLETLASIPLLASFNFNFYM